MQLDSAPACDPKFMRLDRSKSRFITLGELWALSPYDLFRAFLDLFRALYIYIYMSILTRKRSFSVHQIILFNQRVRQSPQQKVRLQPNSR